MPLFFFLLGSRDMNYTSMHERTHKDTHINLSLFNGGLHVQRLNSVSCSSALRCRSRKAFAARNIIYTQTLSRTRSHSVTTARFHFTHNHTANILFPDQHNALSPPQLFLSPSQPGTRFLLVALCAPRNAERSVELSVSSLLQHSL